MAGRGYTSPQIAERIGINDTTVRAIARRDGVVISADAALGRGTRKSLDSNRIVRETVQTVEGLQMGLTLIDFDELDRDEIADWTASLTESIRILNRLNKQLREMAQ